MTSFTTACHCGTTKIKPLYLFVCLFLPVRVIPASTRISPDQLQHFSYIANRSISDDENLTGIGALHGLLEHPGERPQQVGSPHVGSHPLQVLGSLQYGDL